MTRPTTRHRRSWHRTFLAALLAIITIGAGATACTKPGNINFPEPRIFGQGNVVTYADGETLAKFSGSGKPGEGITYDPVDQDLIVPTKSMKRASQYIGWAMIDAEDANFYTHNGAEPEKTILRSASGGGGSTITMQLMYIRFLQRGLTLWERVQRNDQVNALARKYEQQLIQSGLSKQQAKNQILGEYANQAGFCRQSRGVEAASRSLFGHGIRSSRFNLTKAVILAALLKDPCHYSDNPKDPKFTELSNRGKYVLNQMLKKGHISQNQYDASWKIFDSSGKTKLSSLIKKSWSTLPGIAATAEPFVAQLAPMWLKGQFDNAALDMLGTSNLKFTSTINARMQSALDSAARDNVSSSNLVAGGIVINAFTGEIMAIRGGNRKNFSKNQRNYAVTEPRRGGSTSKVFTLAKAFDEGRTPQDLVDCPKRLYKYDGPGKPLTLTEAIKKSVNTCFLKLITELGPRNVVNFTNTLLDDNKVLIPGSPNPKFDAVPTFTLGTSEMTAYQRAAAIIPIANRQGKAVKTRLFSEITQAGKSKPVWEAGNSSGPEVITPSVAQTTFDTLTVVSEPGGTAEGLGIPGRRIMMKTGTDTHAQANAAVTFVAADQESGLICSVDITSPNGGSISGATSEQAGKICNQFYRSVL
jgi:penicillin-binding protein 1A